MKSNLRYTFIDLIFSLLFLPIPVIGLVILVPAMDWTAIICAFMFLACLAFLGFALFSLQWFEIEDRVLIVKNIFGVVYKIRLKEIKKALVVNVPIFYIKTYVVRRPVIALSRNISLGKWKVERAYNTKKSKYIVLPDTPDIRAWLCEEYRKASGEALIIK